MSKAARSHIRGLLCCALIILTTSHALWAQSGGTIIGTVVLADREIALHGVSVLLVQLGRTVTTKDDGAFEFRNVPAGQYDLVASSPGTGSEIQSVTMAADGTLTVDFRLKISQVRQEITVTASGSEVPAIQAFQTVNSLDSFDLSERGATGLGDVLESQPGVAKRSFGPGTARPVIRGFDGDRVLIMQDGVRTGTLSSQSGDHGEPINVLDLERLEVVKGPATLLYGSNAIGGVVNAVSGHHEMREYSPEGLRGYLTGIAGSGNRYGGGGAGFEYGVGKWLLWAGAGNQKTGDYKTPAGSVQNSATRLTDGSGGLGWYGNRSFVVGSYEYGDGIYGIPVDPDEGEILKLDFFRRNARITTGIREVASFADAVRFSLNYSSWNHKELEFPGDAEPEVGTSFDNKQYTYQVFVDQKRAGRLTGKLGFYGMHRNFFSAGEEAIAPPSKANVVAVFGLEEVSFDAFKLQFGGRLENMRYAPEGALNRSFTGLSGAFGINVPTWQDGAIVANYTHSYRAPALEELYNNGPHAGNLTFEIGNEHLKNERSDGIEFSVRHSAAALRASANYYYYDLGNFVYLAPTGLENEGLTEAVYSQDNSRFTGMEGSIDAQVHPYLWVNGGLDYVNAELKATKTPLPRIPPLRGHIGLDLAYRGLSIRPELVMARTQNRIFDAETTTPGYNVVNLTVSYTFPSQHLSHHLALNAFNMGNRLYSNHVSFIKDIAPEIGRGVKLTYSMKFF